MASSSSVWPLPSTPATPRISPRWTVNETSSSSTRPSSSVTVQPADPQRHLVGHRRLPGVGLRELAADHQLGEVTGRHVGGQHLGHRAPGPDHGDGVGHLQHLVQLVRDEDDGDAPGDQPAEGVEQLVDLLGDEHGGRLVEDDDPGVAVEHLEDLGPLLVADAELGHQLVGVDVEPVVAAELEDALAGRADVHPQPGAGLVAEHDVLPDGQVVGQHEVLEHHADADGDGVPRGPERLVDAVDEDAALVGALRAVEDLHQRRLPGPVLADDGVDGAGHHPEVDAVVGDDAREALDDVAQLDRWRGPRRGPYGVGHGVVLVAGREGGAGCLRRPLRCSTVGRRSAARLGRDRDLPGDDVRLELLQRAGVLVDVLVGDGVADAVVLQVVGLDLARELAVERRRRWPRRSRRRPA